MLLVACGSSAPPVVSTPAPGVDIDDRAVMKAVLNDLLRPERTRSTQLGRADQTLPPSTKAVFLIFDATVAVCEGDPIAFRSGLPGCIESSWLDHIRRAATRFDGPGEAAFKKRNTHPLPIRGELTEDVVYIPASVERIWQLEDLLRNYPGSAVVAFSAPSYPGVGSAVIAYRYFGHGVGGVRLQRSAGEWVVATSSRSTE